MGRLTRTLGSIPGAIGFWLAVMVTVSVGAASRQNGAPAGKGPSTAITMFAFIQPLRASDIIDGG